jgi:hypothetical protein
VFRAYSSAGLERTPDKREVDGSSPFRPILILISTIWGLSSAGRAPALQAGGHRFDPVSLHWQKCQCSYLENWILRNNELKKHRKLRDKND